MDWVEIVLLITPVFLPIMNKLPVEELGEIGNLNPAHVEIWFGVLFCTSMQVSFLSPPSAPRLSPEILDLAADLAGRRLTLCCCERLSAARDMEKHNIDHQLPRQRSTHMNTRTFGHVRRQEEPQPELVRTDQQA